MRDTNEFPDDVVVISGGSGFVGRALIAELQRAQVPVVVLSRKAKDTSVDAPVLDYAQLDRVRACRAVVNLAGENIAGGRWTAARRKALRDSRLETTARLCDWIRTLERPPACMVSASAIGFYGDTGEQSVSEEDAPASDFAAVLCRDWEAAVQLPPETRKVILRIGVVLGAGGGALARMLPPFRLGLGGRIGSGQQWMSWVAMSDLTRLIVECLSNDRFCGVYNAVAPEPVRNAEFARALGAQLHRPAVVPVPAWSLRMMLGEMSSLLLGSQRVLPGRLNQHGFEFRYPELNQALAQALARTAK